jgi:hypothetical protein
LHEADHSFIKGKRISYRPQSSHRDPARGLRQRLGFEHGFPLIRSLRASTQEATSVLFSFLLSLLIVAGPLASANQKRSGAVL